MFKFIVSYLFILLPFYSLASDISLTVEEYDATRNRASLLSLDTTIVPLGTVLRIHGKTGSCELTITEQVNDHLIGRSENCALGTITPGMKLAYSQDPSWSQPRREPAQITTNYDNPDLVDEIVSRLSVFGGHNFSSQLEGNVQGDGSRKNLDGDTAFTLGLKGRVYDFTDQLSLAVELGYESPRTLDQETVVLGDQEFVQGTQGYSPRLSIWSLAVQGEAHVLPGTTAFLGMNYSIPSLGNSPFDMTGQIGFQGGANYEVIPQVAVEALIKITNMSLNNGGGDTTDVSLAGLELRGRYSFQ